MVRITALTIVGLALISSPSIAAKVKSAPMTRTEPYDMRLCKPSGTAYCLCDRRCYATGEGQGNEVCIQRCLKRGR